MTLRSHENYVGAWAFLIGVVLAVLIGLSTSLAISFLITYSKQIYAILVLLGVIVGFLGVTGKDSQTFLIAAAVLVIVSGLSAESIRGSLIGIGIGDAVNNIFSALIALFAPAAIIVSLKTVFSIAKV
ncbi:MAG: hypothetical protein WDZ77_00370 [Candidatus Pacearchaeota archaeon]